MKQAAWITVVAGMLTAGPVFSEGTETSSFKTSLNLGFTMTDGNSQTLQLNSSLVSQGEREGLGSVRAGLEMNYGESKTERDTGETVLKETETTVENARAFAGLKKTLTPKTYGSLDGSWLYDDIAAIDYRAMLSSGLGVYLIKESDLSLSVDLGPAYLWEKVDDRSDDYFALRVAQRLDVTLSETAKLWQSAEYLPKADDFEDYLLSVELGIEASIRENMNLRMVLQNKFDSTPGEGLEKRDLTLLAGLGISL